MELFWQIIDVFRYLIDRQYEGNPSCFLSKNHLSLDCYASKYCSDYNEQFSCHTDYFGLWFSFWDSSRVDTGRNFHIWFDGNGVGHNFRSLELLTQRY